MKSQHLSKGDAMKSQHPSKGDATKSQLPSICWQLQLLHLLLFTGAVYCALFLRGSALIAYGVLLAAPLAMLVSLIPFKYLPFVLRQILQLLISGVAFFWASRQFGNAPVDLTLVEIASVLAIALFIGRARREYALLFFISIGFLGYGGLLPTRPFFLAAFIVSTLVALAILCRTRTEVLAPPREMPARTPVTTVPAASAHQPILTRLLHFTATFVTILLMLHHLPQTQALKTRGLIPVSFLAEQPVEFPQMWDKWHKSATDMLGGDAQNNSERDDDTQNQQKSELQSDPTARKIADAPQFPAVDSRGGNGSWSSTGTGLVFRARTPAKLYWVMQMYDTYDGNQWTCSPSMLTTTTGPDLFKPVHEVEVPQHITMEAPDSKLLPHQYRARHASVPVQDNHSSAFSQSSFAVTLSKLTLKLCSFKQPPLPWRYRVQSFVPNPEMKKPLRAWREPARNFGWNYRRLPENIISKRLRTLAHDITKNAVNPYEKAVAIRNYLWTNYTYSLDVPAVPADKEVVDYFLFESKTGYCQHFAQAFTVLARLAGLHSRLVLGYAPGNYNLLTNTFEVFQYHAHAWTHVFAEPYGWLTFDGVAPGNLNLRNTPALLNNLIDPYDEAWKSRPPELTYIPPPPPEKSMVKAPEDNAPQDSIADQIYEKAADDNRTTDPNAAELGKAAAQILWQRASQKTASVWERITQTLVTLWKGIKNIAVLTLFALTRIHWTDAAIAAFAIITLAIFAAQRHRFYRMASVLYNVYACRRELCAIIRRPLAPTAQIEHCHAIAIRLIKLTAIHRPPRLDMAEWSDSLKSASPELADAIKIIANALFIVQFSGKSPSQETAQNVTRATVSLTSALSPYLSDAMTGK